MARIPRFMIAGEPTAYHIISRTALEGYPIGEVEKDFFVNLMARLSRLYFTEVMGFCCMGNHFHLLVRMLPDTDFTDGELRERLAGYYKKEPGFFQDGQLPYFREKLGSLSEYVKEIKLGFSRFYNKRHDRKGYFWGDRFKSLVVENGETLINCLAYIDLNPVQAKLVSRPEDYRWSSIGYHVQTGNRGGFLSLDFGLAEFGVIGDGERLRRYRRFIYETGAVDGGKEGAVIEAGVVEAERENDYELTRARRFRYRTRYFTDSGIIGGKAFVSDTYRRFRGAFGGRREKVPKPISGLAGVYSLKRLTE